MKKTVATARPATAQEIIEERDRTIQALQTEFKRLSDLSIERGNENIHLARQVDQMRKEIRTLKEEKLHLLNTAVQDGKALFQYRQKAAKTLVDELNQEDFELRVNLGVDPKGKVTAKGTWDPEDNNLALAT